VSDELLIPRVWGGESATREQLNTLIHRTRVTLVAAGLNGPGLIERAPGGKSTRARVAERARVSVV
jgi:DNA-binding winged helix-turn-helix (wHTH) protein